MKQLIVFLLLFLTTSCSSILNGITGHFSHFDSTEYYQTVEIQVEVSESKELCTRSSQEIRDQLAKVDKRLATLRLYALGRPYNEPTVNQIEVMKREVVKAKEDLNNSNLSKKICLRTIENLEDMADRLKSSSGNKKL